MKFLLLLTCVAVFSVAVFAQGSRVKIDTQKMIADATPASLPQSPMDDRLGTDARDSNLKGKVKSISSRITEIAEPGYPEKMLTAEDFYNEAGNRVRSIDWDEVHPLGVSVYGYLDKMRVSRRGTIKYAAGCEPSAGQKCPPVMHTLPMTAGDRKKGDDRYDIRWIYKYDSQGRLAEEAHFNNGGQILTRTTYTYETPVRRVVLHFAAGPQPLARVMEIIDPSHGNIAEERLYDEDQKVNSIRYYTYKLDGRGNWIEQMITGREPSENQAKPVSITYRAITYYE